MRRQRRRAIRDLGPTTKLKKANAPEQFEAFVMQSFIEEMLPKSADGVFGSGLAGDYWRSMLAEQVAGQVAKRGGIGIAKMISGGDHAGIKDSLSSIPRLQSQRRLRLLWKGAPWPMCWPAVRLFRFQTYSETKSCTRVPRCRLS